MGLIDRILKGDFDDEDNNAPAAETSNRRDPKGARSPERPFDPDEEEDEVITDEDGDLEDSLSEAMDNGDEDEFEDIPSEEIDDEDPTVIMEVNSDIPSEAWMKEYLEESELDVSESEPALTALAQYVEKPKQSKVREIKKPMNEETNKTPVQTAPKQAATKTATAGTKKRGAPHKLTEHAEEVCRLYIEGVGAKTIAEKFSVSVSCVINTLKRNNVDIRPKGRRKTSD